MKPAERGRPSVIPDLVPAAPSISENPICLRGHGAPARLGDGQAATYTSVAEKLALALITSLPASS